MYVGLDPIVGLGENFRLDSDMVRALHSRNVMVLQQACLSLMDGLTRWKLADDLKMDICYVDQWNNYIKLLRQTGITISHEEDIICWGLNSGIGTVSARLAYSYLMKEACDMFQQQHYKKIWHLNCSPKIRCFTWLVLNDKVLTWKIFASVAFRSRGCVFFADWRKRGWTISLVLVLSLVISGNYYKLLWASPSHGLGFLQRVFP